jgi:hypothetical protein
MKSLFAFLFALPPEVMLGSTPLFSAFGDWGDDTASMTQISARLKAEPKPKFFVGLLGDNFYPDGAHGLSDPRWSRLFKKFSSVSSKFLVALGNHDHILPASVDAQVAYSKMDPKWVLPARYYVEHMYLGTEMDMCVIVLDTHVFDDVQKAWFEQELISCQSRKTFRIVLTHYPLLTVGVYVDSETVAALRSILLPLIDQYDVHAYLSGHEHQMQVFEHRGTHYIISGATAQTDRNNGFVSNVWNSELRFVNDKSVGFVSFYATKDPNVLSYRFLDAKSGKTLYSSSISLSLVKHSILVGHTAPPLHRLEDTGNQGNSSAGQTCWMWSLLSVVIFCIML